MPNLSELIRKRKTDKRVDKPLQGRVVSSYYGAEDLQLLFEVAEQQGVAPGGLQHEATMLLLERFKGKSIEERLEPTDARSIEKSKQALDDLAKLINEEPAS